MTPNTDGWSEAEMYVTKELVRLSKKVDSMDEKLTNLRVEVAQKGALWGAISGTAVSVVAWLRSHP